LETAATEMLGLEDSVDQPAKANGVRWYGHVLRRDGDRVLRKALEFKQGSYRFCLVTSCFILKPKLPLSFQVTCFSSCVTGLIVSPDLLLFYDQHFLNYEILNIIKVVCTESGGLYEVLIALLGSL